MSLLSRRKKTTDTPAANGVIAAATLVNRAQVASALSSNRVTGGTSGWQQTAWEHYDRIGELRFGCSWLGNALSRARLFAATAADADADPAPLAQEDPASVALAALCGGPAGQSEMLKRLGYHLTVPGESFLVGWDNAESGEQEWSTLCSEEIREDATGKVVIQRLGEDYELPDDALIVRIWRPHPRRHWEADSPARGLETVLQELDKLTRRVGAEVDSRLAGAGILFLPQEIEIPRNPTGAPMPAPGQIITNGTGPDGGPLPATDATAAVFTHNGVWAQVDADDFAQTLTDVMMAAIGNPDDPSALVPLIVKAPAEQLEHIKHVTFATPLSAEIDTMQDKAIRRLALGLDMPPEVLTGLGDANHWSGWQIEESAVKGTVEPMLELICHALTTGYLLPVLDLRPADTDVVVWYDTAELTQRPDRSGAASELFDRGELSGDALRREAGFGLDDAPMPDERRRRALERLTAADPTITSALLELLGYVQPGDLPNAPAAGELDAPAPDDESDDSAESDAVDDDGQSGGERRALPARPDDDAPQTPPPAPPQSVRSSAADAIAVAWAAVAGTIARHAMDYAGKRLLGGPGSRARRGQAGDVPSWELHTVIDVRTCSGGIERILDGAYRPFTGTPVFDRCGGVIDRHVRAAIVARTPLDLVALEDDVAVLARDAARAIPAAR